ncbi:MAG: OsmC family protein [Ferruginibacter sp.]
MISKTDKHQYFFEVELSRTEGRKGILTAKDVTGSIEIATAPEFTGGVPDIWTPEHLFLGAVSSGFMTTYLALADKRNLRVAHITCAVIGQINLYEAHLEFTTINLYPKIYIESEEDRELANELLLSAYSYCIIANSINPLLVNHGEVLLERPVLT